MVPLRAEDRVGQRRQEPVHQRRQALRIVLVGFRDRGEAPDVGEHDGHLALLAAEHQLLRRLRELLDQRRRQILAERRADLPALRLLPDEAGEDQREVDRRGRQQRIGEVDQQPMLRVEVPGRADQQGCEQRADDNERDRSEHRREYDHQQPEHECGEQFDADGVIRLRQQRMGQGALEHLGVDFDPRHRRIDRRGLDVVQPDRRGADQHQLARDLLRRDPPLEHIDRVAGKLVLIGTSAAGLNDIDAAPVSRCPASRSTPRYSKVCSAMRCSRSRLRSASSWWPC